ncbi:MerR family transcriptional regulator [Amycolatopsis azurea]|uniref:MerR family transcriptional regulator n=1 Tax=Amycolatopsis azurea DSM 43854 TaxID=1238180 RepID=M2PV17_9PSEU|nr:MerR family transcriptional regulator [Amycolatopsis azurea]EMD23405.1 regulatory protein, MerR [Amycolatopsis azurea DSM 43854]OOC04911.1 MerR family transcriptional regulator [Amycolatopsis azurea DSM 43854]
MTVDGVSRLLGSSEVARSLGVSQVTLRSWEQRYGIGAGQRAANGRRRYSPEDVRRLRRMRALQAQGTSAREAAELVLTRSAAEKTAKERGDRLVESTEALDMTALAGLLDEAFETLGVASTWTEVISPVLKSLGIRWNRRGEGCVMASEWALATAADSAVDRYTGPGNLTAGRRPPVLLLSGPAERHELPIKMLGAALQDDGAPAMYLGTFVSVDVLHALKERFLPHAIVIWSMTPHSADVALLRALHTHGIPVRPSGPGWAGLPIVGEPVPVSFTAALDELGG